MNGTVSQTSHTGGMTSQFAQTRSEQGLSLLRSGYLFASRVRRRAGLSSDSGCPVRMPLLGKQTVLVRGEEASSSSTTRPACGATARCPAS